MVGVTSPLQCAGLNRLEVEDARALRERSSEPLGLESCYGDVPQSVQAMKAGALELGFWVNAISSGKAAFRDRLFACALPPP